MTIELKPEQQRGRRYGNRDAASTPRRAVEDVGMNRVPTHYSLWLLMTLVSGGSLRESNVVSTSFDTTHRTTDLTTDRCTVAKLIPRGRKRNGSPIRSKKP